MQGEDGQSPDTCHNPGAAPKYPAEQKKPGTKEYVTSHPVHTKFSVNSHSHVIKKIREVAAS
jgi:hypothetical protein